jgi:antitoxin component YwqK of YwqJK toxin-antitoxin module
MYKLILFHLLLIISSAISFAQENNYSPDYLEKVKCRACELKVYNYTGSISHIRTFKQKKTGKDTYVVWNGYDVIYYDNGNPKRVSYLYKEINDGEYIEFYPNGNIKEKGFLKKTLKHGTWTNYDSTGKIIQTIKFKRGNDVRSNKKYYFYFTYGLPKFREESYDQCEDSIEQKWQIKYKSIAGCCVNNYIVKLARKNNRKTETKMSRLHGPHWEARMEKEIKEICSKK